MSPSPSPPTLAHDFRRSAAVAVYLTNASTPLAVNVIIQAQTTIVAGPG